MENFMDPAGTFLKVMAGSIAYGLNTPDSDTDIRGIYYQPDDGFLKSPEEFRYTDDYVLYNIKKYFELALNCNPNICELLYIDNPEHILKETEASLFLKQNRSVFLTQKAFNSYCGYADAQIKRMRNHQKWIVNPQSQKMPVIEDYCKFVDKEGLVYQNLFPQQEKLFPVKINKSLYRIYASTTNPKITSGIFVKNNPGQIREHDSSIMKDFVGVMFVNRSDYEKAHNDWLHYWNWKNKRNVIRGELEDQYGYDCKFASHAVRLLKQGYEILKYGNLEVFRKDKEELLAIKTGKWTYEEVLKYAENIKKELENIVTNNNCAVPKEPDLIKINDIYKQTINLVKER